MNSIASPTVKKTAYFTREHSCLYGRMVRLMIPLILSNILQQFYNTADAFVLGRFADEHAFAAVGIASSILNLFLFAIVGACTGISVLFSQYAGAADEQSFRNEHFMVFAFGLAGSVILSCAGILLIPAILHVTHVPYDLQSEVHLYLIIVFTGLPASWLYNMYSAILRSVQRTAAILSILAIAVIGNLALDFLFVALLKKGIAGAAIATAAAQGISAILGFWYLKEKKPELLFRREDCHVNRGRLFRTIQLAFVTAVHQTSLYCGKLCIQTIVNTGGAAMISAYTATTRIEGFANSFGDSGAAATSVITAQSIGASKSRQVKESFHVSLRILTALGAACSAILFLSATPACSFLLGTAAGAAQDQAVTYLRIVALFYLFCFTGNTYAGYYDGIGKVQLPFIGAVSHISIRMLLSFLLIRMFHMTLGAVAIATGIGWVWATIFWEVLRRRNERKEGRRNASPSGYSQKKW